MGTTALPTAFDVPPADWTAADSLNTGGAAVKIHHDRHNDPYAWIAQLEKMVGLHLVKTADESVNNSAALQNDDHMFFSIAAQEVYFVELGLIVVGVSVNADLKIGWSLPAACTMFWGAVSSASAAIPTFGASTTASTPTAAQTEASTPGFGLGNQTQLLQLMGWIVNGANAGTVNFQWAQNTATVENVTLKKYSWMKARKIA